MSMSENQLIKKLIPILKTWNDMKISNFIKLCRSKECLWNPHSPDYLDTNAKHEALNDITSKMNIKNFTWIEAWELFDTLCNYTTSYVNVSVIGKILNSNNAEIHAVRRKWVKDMSDIVKIKGSSVFKTEAAIGLNDDDARDEAMSIDGSSYHGSDYSTDTNSLLSLKLNRITNQNKRKPEDDIFNADEINLKKLKNSNSKEDADDGDEKFCNAVGLIVEQQFRLIPKSMRTDALCAVQEKLRKFVPREKAE